jgi:endonuclease/exonuclease/phosphatase family metal-dependent hydrolase
LTLKLYKTRPNFGSGAKRIVLLALAILMLATPVAASALSAGGPKVTVMTRNIYLGADLSPALDATTIDGAIDGSGVIWNELLSTNFPERAVPLAREIKASGADLVGLQEVALWRQQIPSDLGAPPTGVGQPATQVKFDFLALLTQQLDAIGANYEVVHVQQEFDAELPADLDQNNATGSPPFGAELDGRLTMRDVILHKRDSKVRLVPGTATGANYQTKYTPLIAGAIPLPVNRGWNSVEATINGGRDFRFVNTHLEAFGDDTIREAQAKELFAPGGPINTSKQVILVGDLNSGTEARHNIHGTDQLAFQALQGFGMNDNGAVQSCCYSDMFDPTEVFDHTVDHVLTKPALKTHDAYVTGNDPSQRTPSGLWPSDHGGVVSTVHIRK